MTRIGRTSADLFVKSDIIRADPSDPRHPRSIPAISVLIRSIRLIRVLFLFTNSSYMHLIQRNVLTPGQDYGIINTISTDLVGKEVVYAHISEMSICSTGHL